MWKYALIGCAILLAASPALAQIYRWVDETGLVHYSDTPHAGAEEVVLPDSPTPEPRATAGTTAGAQSRSEPANDNAVFDYASLTVASPAAEETLWNIGGVLTVVLNLQPALQPGHRLRVYFDGQPQAVDGLQFELQEVYRGTHKLQAEVLDETGQLMIRSQPSRFFVHQTSILN